MIDEHWLTTPPKYVTLDATNGINGDMQFAVPNYCCAMLCHLVHWTVVQDGCHMVSRLIVGIHLSQQISCWTVLCIRDSSQYSIDSRSEVCNVSFVPHHSRTVWVLAPLTNKQPVSCI